MKFGRGYRPDPEDYVRAPFVEFERRLGDGVVLPSFTKNCLVASAACPVLNQDVTSGCTSTATACATATSCSLAGEPLGFVPSQSSIYKNGRLIDNPNAPLADEGAVPNEIWSAISLFGVRPMVPLEDRFSDLDPKTINVKPTSDELQAEHAMVLVGEYGITSTSSQRANEVQKALTRRVITVGIEADRDAIQNYDGRVLTAADLGANTDHYIVLVDFAVVGGRLLILCRQSWGDIETSGWGVEKFLVSGIPAVWPAKGHFIVDASVLATMTDIVVADVRRKAA